MSNLDKSRSLGLKDTKFFKKRAMKMFLFNYLMLDYVSPIATFLPPTSVEKILDQSTFLNPHTRLDFSSDNSYFYCIPPRNISGKFTMIKDLCRFLQPGLISSTKFDEKLSFPTANHKIIYKRIMNLVPNNFKHLFRTETSQKSLLETFYSLLQQ